MRELFVAFVKCTLSQRNGHCTRNCIFLVLLGDWKLLFCDEKLFKSLLYLCIYFVHKITGLVLERLHLLGLHLHAKVVNIVFTSRLSYFSIYFYYHAPVSWYFLGVLNGLKWVKVSCLWVVMFQWFSYTELHNSISWRKCLFFWIFLPTFSWW